MLFEKALSIAGAPLSPSGDGPLGGEASHVKNGEERGSLVWSSLHVVFGDLVGLKELAVAGAIQEELGLVACVEKTEMLVCIDHEKSEDQVFLGILLHGSGASAKFSTRAEMPKLVEGVSPDAPHGRHECTLNKRVHQASCSCHCIINIDATVGVHVSSVGECISVAFDGLQSQGGTTCIQVIIKLARGMDSGWHKNVSCGAGSKSLAEIDGLLGAVAKAWKGVVGMAWGEPSTVSASGRSSTSSWLLAGSSRATGRQASSWGNSGSGTRSGRGSSSISIIPKKLCWVVAQPVSGTGNSVEHAVDHGSGTKGSRASSSGSCFLLCSRAVGANAGLARFARVAAVHADQHQRSRRRVGISRSRRFHLSLLGDGAERTFNL